MKRNLRIAVSSANLGMVSLGADGESGTLVTILTTTSASARLKNETNDASGIHKVFTSVSKVSWFWPASFELRERRRMS